MGAGEFGRRVVLMFRWVLLFGLICLLGLKMGESKCSHFEANSINGFV